MARQFFLRSQIDKLGRQLSLSKGIRSIPALIFAITIIALTGPSMIVLPFIMGVTRFLSYGRLIRAQTLRVKENEYVTASKALGVAT